MLDDVVGLVLMQVIGNLGSFVEGGFTPATVIRPVFVSIAYAVLVPVLLLLGKTFVTQVGFNPLKYSTVLSLATSRRGKFLGQTALLGALTSAAYAGMSVLFAAYLAGLLISSASNLDARSEALPKPSKTAQTQDAPHEASQTATAPDASKAWEMVSFQGGANELSEAPSARQKKTQQPHNATSSQEQDKMTGIDARYQTLALDSEHSPSVYETYYANTVDKILKPFFFVTHCHHPQRYTAKYSTESDLLFHSEHETFRSLNTMARRCLRCAHGHRKISVWSLAHSVFEALLHSRS